MDAEKPTDYHQSIWQRFNGFPINKYGVLRRYLVSPLIMVSPSSVAQRHRIAIIMVIYSAAEGERTTTNSSRENRVKHLLRIHEYVFQNPHTTVYNIMCVQVVVFMWLRLRPYGIQLYYMTKELGKIDCASTSHENTIFNRQHRFDFINRLTFNYTDYRCTSNTINHNLTGLFHVHRSNCVE